MIRYEISLDCETHSWKLKRSLIKRNSRKVDQIFIPATHSVWPYPSTIKQPSEHLMNVSTLPASGALPTTCCDIRYLVSRWIMLNLQLTINLSSPPNASCTFLKTNLSQKLFFLTIPFLNSFSFELKLIRKYFTFNKRFQYSQSSIYSPQSHPEEQSFDGWISNFIIDFVIDSVE